MEEITLGSYWIELKLEDIVFHLVLFHVDNQVVKQMLALQILLRQSMAPIPRSLREAGRAIYMPVFSIRAGLSCKVGGCSIEHEV